MCCLVRREGEENFWWNPDIFHPVPPKTCLSKMERKECGKSFMGK